MKLGSKGMFLGAAAIAGLGLLGAAAHAQVPQEKVTLTDEVFKSVMLLKGIPVDTFFEAMGMFANSMGNDCTFCHASEAVFDKAKFADSTPRIQKARQMIVMMNAINKQYFAGRPRVTCFTCHGGSDRPRSEPDLALQYAEPVFDPNAREIAPDPRTTADQVFSKVHPGARRRRSAGEAHQLRRQGQLLRLRHLARGFPWRFTPRRRT